MRGMCKTVVADDLDRVSGGQIQGMSDQQPDLELCQDELNARRSNVNAILNGYLGAATEWIGTGNGETDTPEHGTSVSVLPGRGHAISSSITRAGN